MAVSKNNIALRDDTLSRESLRKIKWGTTIAIIGLPILVQILGAMILFSSQYPVLLSMPALLAFAGASCFVIGAGIYAVTNRIFLRFSGGSSGLQEWESKTQNDAFAFSYRTIVKGVLIAFVGISALGVLQLLDLLGWIDFKSSQSIVLGTESIAAFTVVITYLIVLLPTLYVVWTIKPLSPKDMEGV